MTYRLFTLPNLVTCCNLVCGCIAVGTAFHGQYQWAFLFIILGAVFDFFDGLTARALGISGPIGKELDSLADVITFGLAPSTVVFYLFHEVHYPEFLIPLCKVLPYTAFIMTAFSALRLAKFNLDTRQSTEFIGLPTPANALFWGSLALGQHAFLTSLRFNAFFLLLFMLLFCWLLVAEVPMLSLKFKAVSKREQSDAGIDSAESEPSRLKAKTWDCRENSWKYILLLGALPCLLLGRSAFAAIILWYIVLSLIKMKMRSA